MTETKHNNVRMHSVRMHSVRMQSHVARPYEGIFTACRIIMQQHDFAAFSESNHTRVSLFIVCYFFPKPRQYRSDTSPAACLFCCVISSSCFPLFIHPSSHTSHPLVRPHIPVDVIQTDECRSYWHGGLLMCLFRMNSKFTNQSTLTLLWEPAPAPWGSGSLDDQLTPGTAILCEAIVLGLTRKALNKKLDPVTRVRWVCVCVSDRAWVHVRVRTCA